MLMKCNNSIAKDSILKQMKEYGRDFRILAISNRHLCDRPFEEQIRRVCDWHPAALVLREKDLAEDDYKSLAENVLDICKSYHVPCILHTYWNVALELGHDAIHLPLPILRELSEESQNQDSPTNDYPPSYPYVHNLKDVHLQGSDLSVKQTFQISDFHKIGTSIHSVEDAIEAQRLGATYVTAGHIFTTNCKKGLPPRGLDFLKNVCDAVTIPVYGIGGIKFNPQQWNDLKEQGASGGCIMSGMMQL